MMILSLSQFFWHKKIIPKNGQTMARFSPRHSNFWALTSFWLLPALPGRKFSALQPWSLWSLESPMGFFQWPEHDEKLMGYIYIYDDDDDGQWWSMMVNICLMMVHIWLMMMVNDGFDGIYIYTWLMMVNDDGQWWWSMMVNDGW